jgi:hypothetical protein
MKPNLGFDRPARKGSTCRPPRTRTVTCRYCGAEGLEWRKTKAGRWRLYRPGARWPHVCKQYEPDEPEDEEE